MGNVFRRNRPYIILFVMTIMLSVLSILFSARMVSNSQHQFCGVLAIRAEENVIAPVNATQHDVELMQARHIAYIRLAKKFHCI